MRSSTQGRIRRGTTLKSNVRSQYVELGQDRAQRNRDSASKGSADSAGPPRQLRSQYASLSQMRLAANRKNSSGDAASSPNPSPTPRHEYGLIGLVLKNSGYVSVPANAFKRPWTAAQPSAGQTESGVTIGQSRLGSTKPWVAASPSAPQSVIGITLSKGRPDPNSPYVQVRLSVLKPDQRSPY
jgi:hypothetical protein